MTEQNVPSYWTYARRYVLADCLFSPVPGPSFPTHLFTVAPQTGGMMDNVNGTTGGTNCDGTPNGTTPVMDQNGNVTQQSPCVDRQTLPDLLQTLFPGATTAAPEAASSARSAASATDHSGTTQLGPRRNFWLTPPPAACQPSHGCWLAWV
jgi:hypothetical protein